MPKPPILSTEALTPPPALVRAGLVEKDVKLSVIVATRNRAQAIGPCLDSIAEALAEAAPLDAEIVVVDNGSTDDTAEVIAPGLGRIPSACNHCTNPSPGRRARIIVRCAMRGASCWPSPTTIAAYIPIT
jgi:Glycosyl transferase family 2